MKQLNDIIDYYLRNDSNYALMITGDWGIGKTYYFKNTLSKQIKGTPTFHNASKTYKPIIVSLFGLSTIEEIQTEIFLSIYPLLKNKSIKLGASIGKSLVKGILKLKGLGEYGEIISETETEKNDWINFSEIVLCFDDFERLSENLSIEELVGYINSIVENESVKVIILANEDKISKANYYSLKEKVIGNSIEFIQDINTAFDSLIDKKFSAFPEYLKFIKSNKDYILEVFVKDSNNLRILNFILTYLQTIYSSYTVNLQKDDILHKYEKEILDKIIKFTITIGYLYKIGEISFKKREDFEEAGYYILDDILNESNKKVKDIKEKTVKEKFLEKHYKEDIYTFFPSIYNFLTGGSTFDATDLVKELKSNLHIQENDVAPQYQIYSELSYPKVFSLNDKEYNSLTRQMLNFAYQGKYEPQSTITIFYFASRFNNPLNLNLEKLEKKIILGLKKGKDQFQYVASLNFYMSVGEDAEHKESLIRIREAALKINDGLIKDETIEKYKELEELYKTNFEEFKLKLLDKDTGLQYKPIFENFSAYNFYLFFLNANGELKWQIINLFKYRYVQNNYYFDLKPDLQFLNNFKIKIEKKITGTPDKGIMSFMLSDFLKTLDESIKRLSK